MLLSPDREPIGISSRLLVLFFSCPTFGLAVLSSGLSLIPDSIFGVFSSGSRLQKEVGTSGSGGW